MPYNWIVNLGGTGIILLLFSAFAIKGAPALLKRVDHYLEQLISSFQKEQAESRETFKKEIERERSLGTERVTLERAAREKSETMFAAEVEKNTKAIQENTDATRQLHSSLMQWISDTRNPKGG